jgi:hypothetical protein
LLPFAQETPNVTQIVYGSFPRDTSKVMGSRWAENDDELHKEWRVSLSQEWFLECETFIDHAHLDKQNRSKSGGAANALSRKSNKRGVIKLIKNRRCSANRRANLCPFQVRLLIFDGNLPNFTHNTLTNKQQIQNRVQIRTKTANNCKGRPLNDHCESSEHFRPQKSPQKNGRRATLPETNLAQTIMAHPRYNREKPIEANLAKLKLNFRDGTILGCFASGRKTERASQRQLPPNEEESPRKRDKDTQQGLCESLQAQRSFRPAHGIAGANHGKQHRIRASSMSRLQLSSWYAVAAKSDNGEGLWLRRRICGCTFPIILAEFCGNLCFEMHFDQCLKAGCANV